MREISAEMSGLIDQQSTLLNSETILIEMSGEELSGYAQRSDRLSQLSQELSGHGSIGTGWPSLSEVLTGMGR